MIRLFRLCFADLKFDFCLPEDAERDVIQLPEAIHPFLTEDYSEPSDVIYDICLTDESPLNGAMLVETGPGVRIYQKPDGWLRLYRALSDVVGNSVCCLNTSAADAASRQILYYPRSLWKKLVREWNFLHLIGIEQVLIGHDAFILHSSVVRMDDGIILFVGPSGIGKSTQAANWERYLGAEVINGDRCVVRRIGNCFYGCGSPWSGTSGIYRNDIAPAKAVIFLRQGPENRITDARNAGFRQIFQNTIINGWDDHFVMKLTELILAMLDEVPVFQLTCRPDEEAVRMTYNYLKEGKLL